ncbi:protein kinase [Amycolatopsis sp. NPDC049159]|uniref:serine/threonine-protein kinase n=1 Tax=Amycolatopsis sp. NPDC049159 TaxID=3157210 RepID=UPI0033EF4CE2
MADEAGRAGSPTAGPSDDVTCARYVLGEFTTGPRREPDDERPPTLLAGRYEVGRLIGSGGTARVYRAYDLRLEREVAVKIYDRDAMPVDQRRRLRETTIQASISHPGVVALLDSGNDNGRTFLVMQLVEGENLAERLLSGPMPAAEVTELADGLVEALAHVHARRVVHRDLKPANVFLSAAGPLIGDFGIAHALDTTHITGTGVVPGTAAYLAPEQVSGEPAGPPADVYALGLILLECLTGEREYAGTMVEAAMARLSRPPRIPADVPASLAHTLRRMTRREPRDRPTAEEVRELLRSPAPVTPFVRRPLWRRRLKVVTTAELAAGAATDLAAASIPGSARGDQGTASAELRHRTEGTTAEAPRSSHHPSGEIPAAEPHHWAPAAGAAPAAEAARSGQHPSDAVPAAEPHHRAPGADAAQAAEPGHHAAGTAAQAGHHRSGATPAAEPGHHAAQAAHYRSDATPAAEFDHHIGNRHPNDAPAAAEPGSPAAAYPDTALLTSPSADPRPARRRRMAVAGALATVAVAAVLGGLLTLRDTGTTTPAQPPAPVATAPSATSATSGPLADRGTPDPQQQPRPSVTPPSLEPAAVTHPTPTRSAPPTTKPGKIGKGETRGKGKGTGGHDDT